MSAPDVAVIDYGVGNLLSVERAFSRIGATVAVCTDADAILAAPRVVLPGVGAFAAAIAELRRRGLDDVVRTAANRGTPVLGICLGMQLLMDSSQEFGSHAGLGLIRGQVVAVPSTTTAGDAQKIPHIGWNSLHPAAAGRSWNGPLLDHVREGDEVYFVHSYMATPSDPDHTLATCSYGGRAVTAVIGRNNVIGCQFHPEKSGAVGLRILKGFLAMAA